WRALVSAVFGSPPSSSGVVCTCRPATVSPFSFQYRFQPFTMSWPLAAETPVSGARMPALIGPDGFCAPPPLPGAPGGAQPAASASNATTVTTIRKRLMAGPPFPTGPPHPRPLPHQGGGEKVLGRGGVSPAPRAPRPSSPPRPLWARNQDSRAYPAPRPSPSPLVGEGGRGVRGVLAPAPSAPSRAAPAPRCRPWRTAPRR